MGKAIVDSISHFENMIEQIDSNDSLSIYEKMYLNILATAGAESARHKKHQTLTHEVFIIVYALNDFLDDIIKKKTGEHFNHTALAFDKKLEECYTFSMTTNGISKLPFKSRPTGTDYMVYSFKLTEAEYHTLRDKIHEIEKDKRFTYNWTELLNIALKTKFEVSSTAYYCTQFVYNMIKAAGAEVEEEFGEFLSAQNFHKLIKNEKRITFLYRKKIKSEVYKKVMGAFDKTIEAFAKGHKGVRT